MPTLEERVAYLEGQVSEQSHAQREIRDAVRSVEHRVDARFEAVDRRFDAVDRRIDSLDDKVSRQFVWMVGIQVTTLVAIVGALPARPWRPPAPTVGRHVAVASRVPVGRHIHPTAIAG